MVRILAQDFLSSTAGANYRTVPGLQHFHWDASSSTISPDWTTAQLGLVCPNVLWGPSPLTLSATWVFQRIRKEVVDGQCKRWRRIQSLNSIPRRTVLGFESTLEGPEAAMHPSSLLDLWVLGYRRSFPSKFDWTDIANATRTLYVWCFLSMHASWTHV